MFIKRVLIALFLIFGLIPSNQTYAGINFKDAFIYLMTDSAIFLNVSIRPEDGVLRWYNKDKSVYERMLKNYFTEKIEKSTSKLYSCILEDKDNVLVLYLKLCNELSIKFYLNQNYKEIMKSVRNYFIVCNTKDDAYEDSFHIVKLLFQKAFSAKKDREKLLNLTICFLIKFWEEASYNKCNHHPLQSPCFKYAPFEKAFPAFLKITHKILKKKVDNEDINIGDYYIDYTPCSIL